MTTDNTIKLIRSFMGLLLTAKGDMWLYADKSYTDGMIAMAGASGIISFQQENELKREVQKVYLVCLDNQTSGK